MRKTGLLTVLFFTCFYAFSQKGEDLFNAENTEEFANYLLESGQAEFAIKEFERLLYLKPEALDAKQKLMQAFRLSGQYEKGINRTKALFSPLQEMPRAHAIEYSKLLMSVRDWPQAESFWIKSEELSQTDKVIFLSTEYIFESQFAKAKSILDKLQDSSNYVTQGYIRIVDNAQDMKRKSPFLAGVLSAIIPGLGKAYTGDWKDGLVSLIFTGGMAFQAARKFKQFGPGDVRPWIYTSIGSGFYLGGVYGATKSAQNKNRLKINHLQHEASSLFNTYY
ncbi:hypothetical protein LAG90_11355 [Marinilongibacter aquaticus]|uniref:tetratricopeptide repeat protein n=1 Tax=Marinilongibacter aquaticus TaxID=2975157 RepID=UPI0021BD0FF0|nr:hypothetical protein [Marinilongibacter aquaticus]UBM57416.1 hypothetical protein LAG90_11355 [Marinilongibacter aquaticus]